MSLYWQKPGLLLHSVCIYRKIRVSEIFFRTPNQIITWIVEDKWLSKTTNIFERITSKGVLNLSCKQVQSLSAGIYSLIPSLRLNFSFTRRAQCYQTTHHTTHHMSKPSTHTLFSTVIDFEFFIQWNARFKWLMVKWERFSGFTAPLSLVIHT